MIQVSELYKMEVDVGENSASFCIETLKHIQKRINTASRIDEIPKTFSFINSW